MAEPFRQFGPAQDGRKESSPSGPLLLAAADGTTHSDMTGRDVSTRDTIMPAHRPHAAPRPGWTNDLVAARAGSADALGRLLDDFRPYLLCIAGSALDADLQAKAGAS